MLGILELSGVTESRVQCVHSSRVGLVNYSPWPQSGPPSVSVVLRGTASLSIYRLWLPLHRAGRIE